MTKKLLFGFAGTLGLALSCTAQVKSPVLGYLSDGASLHAMVGIPASAAIGPALPATSAFATAAAAPDGNFAVAITADGALPVVVTLGADAQIAPISGANAGADSIVLSPKGSAALIGRSADGNWQVVAGLPSAVSVTRSVSAGSVAAVSDDGQWVVSVSANGLVASGPDGQSVVLPSSGAVTAVQFLSGKHSIVAADGGSVVLITDIDSSAAVTVIAAGSGNPADAPVAVAASADNGQIVFTSASGLVGHVNVVTGAVSAVDCQCSPVGLFGLGDAVFRLTGVNDGAAKVFDAASDNVWFVPQALDIVSGSAQ